MVKHHQISLSYVHPLFAISNSFIRTPWNTSNELLCEYSLERYYESGILISINTDNPGISHTNWTREFMLPRRIMPKSIENHEFFNNHGHVLKYCFVHDINIRVELEECFLNRVRDHLPMPNYKLLCIK